MIIIIFMIDNYLLSYFEPMRVWPQRFWFLEVFFFLSPRPNCSDRQIELVCWGAGVPLRSYPRLLPTAGSDVLSLLLSLPFQVLPEHPVLLDGPFQPDPQSSFLRV